MGYKEVPNTTQTINNLKSVNGSLKAQLAGVKLAVDTITSDYNHLKGINSNTQIQNYNLSLSMDKANNTIRQQVDQINKLYLELSEEKKYRTNDPKLTMEIDKLKKEIANHTKFVENYTVEYSDMIYSIKSLGSKNEQLEKDLSGSRSVNGELRARVCQLVLENKRLKDDKHIMVVAVTESPCDNKDLEAQIKKLTNTVSAQKIQINVLKENRIELHATIAERDKEIQKLNQELSTLVHNHKGQQASIWDYDRELFRIEKKANEDTIVRLVQNEYGYFIDARVWMNERPTTRGLCLKVDQFFELNKQLKGTRNTVTQLIKQNESGLY